jgi:radical SAM superfamily enzyme YgiQ (UPF0313 family)
VRVALGFANRAGLARNNLGFRIVEQMLASRSGVDLEFFHLPESGLPRPGERLRAGPSGSPLSAFDLILFSLSFEGDAPHIPALLEAGGLPALADEREAGHPWVIAGGAAVMINPEPVAAFFDALLIGEAEALLPALLETAQAARGAGRAAQLAALEAIPGAVVPLLREHRLWSIREGVLRDGESHSLRGAARARIPQPEAPADTPVATIRAAEDAVASARLPPEAHFRETLLLELARGCPRRCRFCVATRIYHPLRERPVAELIARARAIGASGDTVGLLALSAGDFGGLEALVAGLGELDFRLSIASLPAVFNRPAALAELVRRGAGTLTIAPEAGTDRLRALCGKPFRNAAILESVAAIGASGVRRVKAYFLIGLPFETDDDLEGIPALVQGMRERLPRAVSLAVTVNPFAPKPRTPFQWAPMAPADRLVAAARRLGRGMPRGVRLRVKSLREARCNAALTRGDARWATRLTRAWREGRPLAQILAQEGTTFEDWTGPIEEGSALPWSYLLGSGEAESLQAEWKRARREAGSASTESGD